MASFCHFALVTVLICACGGPNSKPESMTWATSSPIEQRCRQGDGQACHRAGLMYEEGKGFTIDVARAAALYQRGCVHDDANACYRLGRLHRRGMAAGGDHTRAATLLSTACDQRVAAACAELADMIDHGLLGQPDDDRIAALLLAACDAGDGATCYALARRYEVGLGVAHDFRRAAQLHHSACKRDHFAGCVALGDLYARGVSGRLDHHRAAELYDFACKRGAGLGCRRFGDSLMAGRGRQHDAGAAARAYARGCELGDGRACSAVAALYQRGRGVNADHERAATLRERALRQLEAACTVGDADACACLAVELRKSGDPAANERADEIEARACKAGSMLACAALVTANPDGVDSTWTDLLDEACGNGEGPACMALAELADHRGKSAEAQAQLERGCKGGHESSCAAHGARLLDSDPDAAIAALYRACTLGSHSGCYEHGVALLERGRAVDSSLALTQIERACAAGHGDACHLLGEMYRSGTLVDRNRDTARTFFERACIAESGAGCAAAGLMIEQDHGGTDKAALELYRRACTGGNKLGCRRLGIYHGKRGPAERVQAGHFLDKACRLGDAESCIAHSELLAHGKSAEAASAARAALERARLAALEPDADSGVDLAILKQLCRRDLARACVDVGDHYSKAGTGSGYYRRAAKLLDAECGRHKQAASCLDLAALYRHGRGTLRDEKRALRLIERACKLDRRHCP